MPTPTLAIACPPQPVSTAEAPALPAGALHANIFSLFNALSWQIMLGAPTILYAKSQGATDWVLGLIASLMPLLVIFQIPAAHYLPRYGYRRFILAGWTSRSFFIFAVAAVPLLPVPPVAKVGLIVFCLFGFNLLRGITCGAWMPWLTEFIPEAVRGRFLCRDAVFQQVGALTALLASACLLTGNPRPWQFAGVFLLSAASATYSLVFLRRIPDVTAPERLKSSGTRVPWLHMLLYRPFLRLVLLSVGWATACSALPVFSVAFLKESHYSESGILLLSTLALAGAMLSLPLLGWKVDRLGSKPIVLLSMALVCLVVAGWYALASNLAARSPIAVAALYFVLGVGQCNFTIAVSRLVMATIPLMGRNHFFALYTVIGSVTAGLVPIAWGVALDLIGPARWTTGPLTWNRYSLFFAVITIIALLVSACALRLREPPAPKKPHPLAAASPVTGK